MPLLNLEADLQELFYHLHESGLFSDGKTISDAELTVAPELVVAAYRSQRDIENFDLGTFYGQFFRSATEQCAAYQTDPNHTIEEHIEALWTVLSRTPAEDGDVWSSKIRLPYPYVVPGGRFDEIYYWDSYFTMLGLQVAGHIDLMEGMIDNFAFLIERYGFVPNGNRSYYLGRSQPPFFALMVRLLSENLGDQVLVKYLPSLLKEYEFWMDAADGKALRRVVELPDGHRLNRYFDDADSPRTEMYSDDKELIVRIGSAGQELVTHIRAACESGWDFSSRWLRDANRLESIHTTDILPIDLNCLLYGLELAISDAQGMMQMHEESEKFRQKAQMRVIAINKYCWDSERQCYFDYDYVAGQQTGVLSAAALYPLFFSVANPAQARSTAEHVRQELLKAGGIVSTTIRSGQQWDSPNGWAPQQWIAYVGLMNYEHSALANEIKKRWMHLNEKVFDSTRKMMEKYDVVDTNQASGGGEYPVQDGFGWTNGVYLAFSKQ